MANPVQPRFGGFSLNRQPAAGTGQGGFSVLEALVAMAILAAALLPLLALQTQFVRTTESLERAEIQLSAESIALAHIKSLNLDQTPKGTIPTPYGVLEWSSTPALPTAAGRGATGFPSRFVMTLYIVEVQFNAQSGQNQQFTLHGLGWHPTKPFLKTF